MLNAATSSRHAVAERHGAFAPPAGRESAPGALFSALVISYSPKHPATHRRIACIKAKQVSPVHSVIYMI